MVLKVFAATKNADMKAVAQPSAASTSADHTETDSARSEHSKAAARIVEVDLLAALDAASWKSWQYGLEVVVERTRR